MPRASFTEADLEQAALDWLSGLGWQVAHGPNFAPDMLNAERGDYGQVVLERRLQDGFAISATARDHSHGQKR